MKANENNESMVGKKKFNVYLYYEASLYCEVVADSEEKAIQIAKKQSAEKLEAVKKQADLYDSEQGGVCPEHHAHRDGFLPSEISDDVWEAGDKIAHCTIDFDGEIEDVDIALFASDEDNLPEDDESIFFYCSSREYLERLCQVKYEDRREDFRIVRIWSVE